VGEAIDTAGAVLSAAPPTLTADEAARVASELFGVEGVASELRSERDQNFLIETDGGGWVLKVSNAGEDPSVVEMENEALAHITRVDPDLPVPAVATTVEGSTVSSIDGPDSRHLVRLVELMPGEPRQAADLDDAALEALGRDLARLGRALQGFFHPAARRVLQWDLRHASGVRSLLPAIEDPSTAALVTRALDAWDADVAPHFDGLRAQLVHGDLSLDNALLDDRGRVVGIIDFGDITHTALLCDLAATLVSVMAGRDDPLASAATLLRGYQSVTPLEPQECDLLPGFVSMRLATSLAIAAWRLRLYPENAEYIMLDSGRFEALLELLQGIAPAAAAAAMTSRAGTSAGTAALLRRRARVFGPGMQSLTYGRPIHMARAEGVWMIDVEGTRYLDAYNNVPVVGHSHPRVVAALAAQSRLLNTNMRYLHGAAVELAERLVATMPTEIDTCLFVNSGSEANELAWRILTTVGDRDGGVVTEFGYHGVTTATAALSPEEWAAQSPPSNIARIPAPDGYRGWYLRDEPGWAEAYAAHLDDAVAELASHGHEPGVVMVDGGFTSDGVVTPPAEYHHELLRRTHEAGALFVADEVQAGHGRTGEHLWSFMGAGIVPDAVTLGKPMGNGFPVAALLLRSELAAAMAERTTYFSTFGGNPVACAAALAVLDVIDEERLVRRAAETGAYLRDQLVSLAAAHQAIGEVRGRGLLVGVELVRDRETRAPDGARARRVVDGLRERGVLVGRSGKAGSALKIRPPLVFERAHVDLLVECLDDALTASAATSA
jgi:4-aminobutyrate aminotransferase-like enzyme/Ser/Thr protein kinase RdoA (MazF antagonist)